MVLRALAECNVLGLKCLTDCAGTLIQLCIAKALSFSISFVVFCKCVRLWCLMRTHSHIHRRREV